MAYILQRKIRLFRMHYTYDQEGTVVGVWNFKYEKHTNIDK